MRYFFIQSIISYTRRLLKQIISVFYTDILIAFDSKHSDRNNYKAVTKDVLWQGQSPWDAIEKSFYKENYPYNPLLGLGDKPWRRIK